MFDIRKDSKLGAQIEGQPEKICDIFDKFEYI
jgi:hypothetical protein